MILMRTRRPGEDWFYYVCNKKECDFYVNAILKENSNIAQQVHKLVKNFSGEIKYIEYEVLAEKNITISESSLYKLRYSDTFED